MNGMQKIYYIEVTHYWIDEDGREYNRWGEPAIVEGSRRAFSSLDEAKNALKELTESHLRYSKENCRNPSNLVYNSDILTKMENQYCGRQLHIEWLWI